MKTLIKQLKIKKLDPNAKLPTRAYPDDAGLDLYALTTHRLLPRSTTIVRTGVGVEIPTGYEGQVRPKSGRSAAGMQVILGTIDAGYRDDVSAIVFNATKRTIKILAGEKIAQLVINAIELPEVLEVEEFSDSKRGGKGFGSTGLT